jgi:hypothetical protein
MWRIWYHVLENDGTVIGAGVYYKSYKRRGMAEAVAKKHFGNPKRFSYVISQLNPWINN